MITLHVDLDFSTVEFEIDNYSGEFDDEGAIEFEVPCFGCGHSNVMVLRADALRTLLRKAEEFQYARAFKDQYYEIPVAVCSKL